jgi:hypothetical protein
MAKSRLDNLRELLQLEKASADPSPRYIADLEQSIRNLMRAGESPRYEMIT